MPRAFWSCDQYLTHTYQFSIDRQLAILVVGVLHLLVGHKLYGSMRHAQHAGHKASVQSTNTLCPIDLGQGMNHASIFRTAARIALQTETRLNHPNGIR